MNQTTFYTLRLNVCQLRYIEQCLATNNYLPNKDLDASIAAAIASVKHMKEAAKTDKLKHRLTNQLNHVIGDCNDCCKTAKQLRLPKIARYMMYMRHTVEIIRDKNMLSEVQYSLEFLRFAIPMFCAQLETCLNHVSYKQVHERLRYKLTKLQRYLNSRLTYVNAYL